MICGSIFLLLTSAVSEANDTVANRVPPNIAKSINLPPLEPPIKQASRNEHLFADSELRLAYAVLGFGIIILMVQYFLIWNTKSDINSALKMSTVTLVIISTLFVISAGFDSEQIAPAMGLFGTIAGYLLGRETVNKQ